MSIDVVRPLRQRMIEDMTARTLGARTQRRRIAFQAVRRVSPALTRHRRRRGHPPLPAAAHRDGGQASPQPQPRKGQTDVFITRDAAAGWTLRPNLSPARTAKIPR